MISLSKILLNQAEAAIREYGAARVKFRRMQDELEAARLLVGNDNKVGIAGEFWAIRFYLAQGYQLEEVPRHTNNPAYDFRVSLNAASIMNISVKSITAENKHGKTSPVKVNEDWDELCIVEMDENLSPLRFGTASHAQFKANCNSKVGKAPANRRWLEPGWMKTTAAGSVL